MRHRLLSLVLVAGVMTILMGVVANYPLALATGLTVEENVSFGLRMREGITTTLQLFAPLGVRATYYATGYNFLLGNAERRTFMGDPTFAWATRANGWTSDRWATTPWFADDPFGTIGSDPAWYFGDLVGPLQAAPAVEV